MPSPTSRRRFLEQSASTLAALTVAGRIARADAKADASPEALTAKAVGFLKPRQEANGGWSTQRGPGITGIVITSMLRTKRVTPADPVVVKGLGYLEGFLSPKGGIGEGPQANYVTSIALMAFHEANTKGQYTARIKAAQDYLKGLQWDEGEKKGKVDPYYGGAGYGGKSRPDLSNTSFFLDALRDTGLPADDPALQKALVFVSRCQNLKGGVQRPSLGRQGQRWWIHLYVGRRRREHGRRAESPQRRPALLRQHDLRRPQVHDPRRPDPRRPARESRL